MTAIQVNPAETVGQINGAQVLDQVPAAVSSYDLTIARGNQAINRSLPGAVILYSVGAYGRFADAADQMVNPRVEQWCQILEFGHDMAQAIAKSPVDALRFAGTSVALAGVKVRRALARIDSKDAELEIAIARDKVKGHRQSVSSPTGLDEHGHALGDAVGLFLAQATESKHRRTYNRSVKPELVKSENLVSGWQARQQAIKDRMRRRFPTSK